MQGAVAAASAAEAMAASPLSIICVTDYDAADQILASEGIAESLTGKTLVEFSSGVHQRVRSQDAWVRQHAGHFIAGGIMAFPDGIGRPDTVILYSGDRSAFEAHRVTLASLGGSFQYLGTDPCAASVAYTTLGCFVLGALGMFLETATIARCLGLGIDTYYPLARLSTDMMLERIRNSAQRVVTDKFAGDEANIDLALLFLREGCEMFKETGVQPRMTEALIAQLEAATAQGHGDDDIASMSESLCAKRT
jgi:3-hydroxyisobutyrate dehydrogenase-like beta-hydroxyacid dehydrogenase